MKKSKFLVILSLLLALCAIVPQMAINAEAASYVIGNGVSIPNSNIPADGTNKYCNCGIAVGVWKHGCCWNYGYYVYYHAWGVYPNRYDNSTHYLRNLSAAERTLTAGHLQMYLKNAAPGALLRIDTDPTPSSPDSNGHTLIFVQMNNSGNGALFLEGNYDGYGRTRLVEWDFNYLVSQYGRYTYIKYISWPSAPEYTAISYETITEGTYAIKCPAAGSYVTVQDNLDVVGQNILATFTRTGFEIKKSTTTEGYAIRALCSTNRMINVYTEYVTSGNTVCLWDDTGHASQRWYFEKVSGGYVIRSVQTPSCVLTVEGDGDIGVATYSGIPGQIWTLEPYCTSHKYSSATCTKPKTCTNCGATSGKALGHSYSNACDTTCNRSGCKTTRKITHSYTAATCTKPKTCKVCSVTSGKALSHSYKNGKCTSCGKVDPSVKAVKITTQPKNVVVKNGKTAKVTVKASGDGLKYTWYYAKKGSSKYTKASATSSSYSVKMSSSADGRKVYCVIKDKYGNSVKTNVVTLYKGTPAKITTQPKATTVANGKSGSITLKASGSGLKYQWYVKYKGASSFTKVGSSSKTYSFKMANKLSGAQVYCVVKDKYGTTVKSAVVTIKMAPKVQITTQPKNVAVARGKTAKVTVKASGDGLKYTWYYAKKGSSSFKKLSTKSAAYSVKMSSSYDGRKVYCVVKDKYGQTVKTSTVTLSVVKAAKITTQPKSVSGFAGDTLKVTVKASGDGLKYTWYYAKKGASGYTKSSVTCNAIQVKASAAWNGCKIYCVVKDKYGNSVKSNTVTLTVKNAVKITQQPSSFVSAATGSTVKVTVKATGDGLKYQWYYANRWADKWTKSSVTSATYSVKMSSSVHYRTVYCVVKDKYGNSVKSDVVIFFNSVHLDKVEGSWVSTYRIDSDESWGPDFDCRLEIDSDGSAYVHIPDRVTLYTGIEFVKKTSEKYYYQMMEGEEYLQHNSTPYNDGLVDVIYELSTDTLKLQFDYGYTVFFERAD